MDRQEGTDLILKRNRSEERPVVGMQVVAQLVSEAGLNAARNICIFRVTKVGV